MNGKTRTYLFDIIFRRYIYVYSQAIIKDDCVSVYFFFFLVLTYAFNLALAIIASDDGTHTLP